MTNIRLQHRFYSSRNALTRSMALALLVLAGAAVQAQTLRPSAPGLSAPSGALQRAQRPADFIVAVVNTEPVTNHDVRSSMLRAEQQLAQSGGAVPPRTELVRLVLERLISDKAQLQEARQSGLRVDDSSIEGAVQSVAQQNQLSVDGLKKQLLAEGLTYARFRENLRDELLVSRFKQREVEARVRVSDSDIDQFLREQDGSSNAASMDINLAQILVAVPENATPGQVAALQAKAQQAA